jgi:large-conductance mechanosensitive channel
VAAIASIVLAFLAPLLALVLTAVTIFLVVRLALRVRRGRRAEQRARS